MFARLQIVVGKEKLRHWMTDENALFDAIYHDH